MYSDPMTEVYLLFYQTALQPFICLNIFLQREDPVISIVADQLNKFLKIILGKFVSIRYIKEAAKDITDVVFTRENQLDSMYK